MHFFLRYGAFNMTLCTLNASCTKIIFVCFLSIIFYPNKSSDQLQSYSMLNKHVKNIDYDKFKFTTKN